MPPSSRRSTSYRVPQEIRIRAGPGEEWRRLGVDRHSVLADPLFVDPVNGDYRVRPESPALPLGFRNFGVTRAGCQ